MRRSTPVPAILLLSLLLFLAGCVGEVGGSAWTDGRFTWVNVKSASDVAGGPRQDVILVIDRDGRVVGQWQAAGMGVLQALVGSLGPAVMTAAGQAMAGYLTRPARNTTNVELNVAGTGGAGGLGGSNTTTATSTVGAVQATSTGGTGGSATGGSVDVGRQQ